MMVRGARRDNQANSARGVRLFKENRGDQSSDKPACASTARKLGRPNTFYLDNLAALLGLRPPRLKRGAFGLSRGRKCLGIL